MLDSYLESHWLNVKDCREDDFNSFIVHRAISLLDAIEQATGKTITGRSSEEIIRNFGASLESSDVD